MIGLFYAEVDSLVETMDIHIELTVIAIQCVDFARVTYHDRPYKHDKWTGKVRV